ncbi:MAG: TrkH family potassium uptake protein [Phycisphaerae bacterium]|nr:TrkH family potassium uptake protein [Phycisphaerae bacterium]
MDYRYVLRQLGVLFVVLGASMVFSLAWAVGDYVRGNPKEMPAIIAFLSGMAICLVLGGAAYAFGKTSRTGLGRREALLLVGVSWLAGAGLAGLPFYFWAKLQTSLDHVSPFSQYVNCYFETMSGLTTTGASILTNIEACPPAILFWRAFTHWLGGLGIIVLFVAVFPALGVGGKRLFRIESPGPTPEGVRPKIRETARALWLIYLLLTLIEASSLRLCGMSWFEALSHTFATLATGGFSTRNASIGAYDSVAIEGVIIFFMILAGVNFGLYYQIAQGRLTNVLKDRELRVYLGIIAVASCIIIASLYGRTVMTTEENHVGPSLGTAVRYGLFQTVSLQTTTGFCTAEFDHWPFIAKCTLLILMFIGGSGGSTGGGIKVVRIIMAAKIIWAELEKVFRPNVIRPIRVGRAPIDPDLRLATLVYVCIILFLFAAGTILIMLCQEFGKPIDIDTAATAAAATLNNIGPGLAEVRATANYGFFSAPAKIVMSLLMVLGRLEVYAVFVLFMPRFWRSE